MKVKPETPEELENRVNREGLESELFVPFKMNEGVMVIPIRDIMRGYHDQPLDRRRSWVSQQPTSYGSTLFEALASELIPTGRVPATFTPYII